MESQLLALYIEKERTPGPEALVVSAFSRLWVFGLYELLRTWVHLTRRLPNCFRMRMPSTLPCGLWGRLPNTPAQCGGARRETPEPSFPAEPVLRFLGSSVVNEVQNLLEIFPGLALGVLIVGPQQI